MARVLVMNSSLHHAVVLAVVTLLLDESADEGLAEAVWMNDLDGNGIHDPNREPSSTPDCSVTAQQQVFEYVCVSGPSGCGKSTFLSTLARYVYDYDAAGNITQDKKFRLDPQGDGGTATSMTATDYQFLANVRDAVGVDRDLADGALAVEREVRARAVGVGVRRDHEPVGAVVVVPARDGRDGHDRLESLDARRRDADRQSLRS